MLVNSNTIVEEARCADGEPRTRQCSQVERDTRSAPVPAQRPTAIKKGKTIILAESTFGSFVEVRLGANPPISWRPLICRSS